MRYLISPPAKPPKFVRRKDLALEVRVALVAQACTAQINHIWGGITHLSKKYKVSRTFIYSELSIFKKEMGRLFSPEKKAEPISREACEAAILAYRFEGKCSIDAISTLMKRADIPLSSTGFISEYLSHTGRTLDNTLKTENRAATLVVFADDEVFAKDSPVLITVDPVSSAILRAELAEKRTAEVWSAHYQSILDNGFMPRLTTSDAGVAMLTARAETLSDIPWQSDTFHGIAHRLGDWNRRLEKAACAAIERADEREEKLDSARSDAVIEKRLNLCFDADRVTERAIDLYDNFSYLYRELIRQLNTFDSKGNLRPHERAEETIRVALDLIESLGHNAINKEIATIRKALPDLLTYFDDAKLALSACREFTANEDALKTLCLAWQWNKALIKSKNTARRHKAIEQRDLNLELAAMFIEDDKVFESIKERIYEELSQIVQASSMVECINSILRPYLNSSKNQVTQEFLNIFMFYHNHRRYHAGKRKGKTPMEILTGKEQKEDWITLLQQEVREKERLLAA
ncbi:MAG: hypothetical protein ABW115_22570 [Candidatus Thiodiazotropha sp. 6PLUC6]